MNKYSQQIYTLLSAGAKVIEVASYEWQRVHGFAIEVAQKLNMHFYTWSAVYGLQRWDGERLVVVNNECITLLAVLDLYINATDDILLVVEDFHAYCESCDAVNIRYIREMMRPSNYSKLPYAKAIILSSPSIFVPVELSKELPVIDIPLPDKETLAQTAMQVIRNCSNKKVPYEISDNLLQSALGLTVMEAKFAFGKAIVCNGQLTENEIPLILAEKEQIVSKNGLLEFYHSNTDMADIGGLSVLKDWINKRGNAYSDRARQYGLSMPRGLLLLGIPGCGKSLVAKSIAKQWQFPLLRLDIGKVYGGVLGQSENNMRQALEVANAVSPCVLWIDEIEKGLSGLQSSNHTDGGTSARVLGTLLTWMQENTKPVFIVATANSIDNLPAELLRKGRFDEIFYLDLPSAIDRQQIFNIQLANRGRDAQLLALDMTQLVTMSEGFSGAEISQVINEALYMAYDNGQDDIEQDNIVACMKDVIPLSSSMADKISSLRNWASSRTINAGKKNNEEDKYERNKNIFICN